MLNAPSNSLKPFGYLKYSCNFVAQLYSKDMERFFNTAGPNRPDDNYTLEPLNRFDLDDIMTMIR